MSAIEAAAGSETDFGLAESILWEHCCGYWLLPEHLERLRTSAAFFSRRYDEDRLKQRLAEITQGLEPRPHAVRVVVEPDGHLALSVAPFVEDRRPVRAGLSPRAIDPGDVFLYHSTTNRRLYDQAAAGVDGVDEVLLWNEQGELTESCTANLIVRSDGRYLTPPPACGLLPGTYRASLLKEGQYEERPLTLEDLKTCDQAYLINSLIGWREISNFRDLNPGSE